MADDVPLRIDPDLITNIEGDKRALRRTVAAAYATLAADEEHRAAKARGDG